MSTNDLGPVVEPNSRAGFLAIELDGDGAHPAAWRAAAHEPRDLISGERVRNTVLAAESAGFHIASFADGQPEAQHNDDGGVTARLDAVQRAAFAGPLTHSIIVVPEVDTVFTEPFHVATQLASLDYVTGGRAGWLVAADGSATAAAAVGRAEVTGQGLLDEAAASIEVGRRLWDSWEDGAVIKDVSTGRYIDVDKLHYADFATDASFTGKGYSVKGPSIIPRPLQGQLPVLIPQSLVGNRGLENIDAVLLGAPAPEQLAEVAAAFLSSAEANTAAHHVAAVVELEVILDARGQTAAQRLLDLNSRGPWPERHARYVGSSQGLVELLASVLETADGVRLHPAVLDVDLEELSRLVLPELRSRGALAPLRIGATFRDLLGLERPASRFANAGK